MLSYRYTLLYYCRICMIIYLRTITMCNIYIECRPNVLTLDRPKPNVLTLDLALFLCTHSSWVETGRTHSWQSQPDAAVLCILTSDLLTSRPN